MVETYLKNKFFVIALSFVVILGGVTVLTLYSDVINNTKVKNAVVDSQLSNKIDKLSKAPDLLPIKEVYQLIRNSELETNNGLKINFKDSTDSDTYILTRTGVISGKTLDVLIFANNLQTLIPINYNLININKENANISFEFFGKK